MPDYNHKWDLCPECEENKKIATSQRCQACHIKRLGRLRSLRAKARKLKRQWRDGAELIVPCPKGMPAREFVEILRDVFS